MPERLPSLDFLRGIAILAVIFHHNNDSNRFVQLGWMGVDLFFVLSGFLISSLLFDEFEQTRKVQRWRFLMRRGLKIYPLFYLSLIIAATLAFFVFPTIYSHPLTFNEKLQRIGAEAFFMQNYLPAIMPHHWSLAVEEHFYLLLVLLFPLMTRHFLAIAMFFTATPLALRFAAYPFFENPEFWSNFLQTQFRIDSLFAGVIVAYLYRNCMIDYVKWRPAFVATLALPTTFLIFGHYFQVTIGYTLLNIAFGSLLIIFLHEEPPKHIAYRLIAKIGVFSYGIYLFHFYFNLFVELPLWLYVLVSIGVGVLASKLIETPILKVRDRYFPKHQ